MGIWFSIKCSLLKLIKTIPPVPIRSAMPTCGLMLSFIPFKSVSGS